MNESIFTLVNKIAGTTSLGTSSLIYIVYRPTQHIKMHCIIDPGVHFQQVVIPQLNFLKILQFDQEITYHIFSYEYS